VQHRVVLHGRLLADLDVREIPAQHRTEPHVGAIADADVADQHRCGRQPDVAPDRGSDAAELDQRRA
jgi:hypothetical protein